jgi:hypothetical protein
LTIRKEKGAVRGVDSNLDSLIYCLIVGRLVVFCQMELQAKHRITEILVVLRGAVLLTDLDVVLKQMNWLLELLELAQATGHLAIFSRL